MFFQALCSATVIALFDCQRSGLLFMRPEPPLFPPGRVQLPVTCRAVRRTTLHVLTCNLSISSEKYDPWQPETDSLHSSHSLYSISTWYTALMISRCISLGLTADSVTLQSLPAVSHSAPLTALISRLHLVHLTAFIHFTHSRLVHSTAFIRLAQFSQLTEHFSRASYLLSAIWNIPLSHLTCSQPSYLLSAILPSLSHLTFSQPSYLLSAMWTYLSAICT